MLKLLVGATEVYDDETCKFSTVGGEIVWLEHSLISLSKWESKYGRPFLGPKEKTTEETLGYVEAMLVSDFPGGNFLEKLSRENFDEVEAYINQTQSATTFRETSTPAKGNAEIISAELIYFWMISYNIPFECQYWHLSRLFALIRVCNVKNSKPKKRSAKEAAAERKALNEARRAQFGSSG